MALIDVTVAEIVQESPTVRSFTLTKTDGSPLGTYRPGAHIDVVGPTSITRQYSLFSTPDAQDSFAFAVKREENSRGGSAALHELRVGDALRISPPRNLLSIAADATHHVLVAAGIGITPRLPRWPVLHGLILGAGAALAGVAASLAVLALAVGASLALYGVDLWISAHARRRRHDIGAAVTGDLTHFLSAMGRS